ncbi:MAG: glycosyltransferase family 2 protein [Elusimicrobiales bacterium]|nr:glycosyltransferase family 2 protein [Elusimicrobiales bacterium]
MTTTELFFWASLVALVYTYLGYPLVLYLLSRLFKSAQKATAVPELPSVAIVIAAYNEENIIGAKLDNCLKLDYPAEKLEVLVASDGSSDRTDQIVAARASLAPRVRLLPLPRGGKASAINAAMAAVKSDIVVFSDANTMYSPDSIRMMVRNFSDKEVGCVCGRLSYNDPGQVISGKGESAYWRYETVLKRMESRLGYVAGANGAIYAVRRELFEPLPPDTINDDFTVSMRIVLRGYKCLYEREAVAYEDVAPDVKSEFRRHVRDGAGHYIAVLRLAGLLNPFLGLKSFIYWSHRILRWAAPFLLIGVFIANLALVGAPPYSGLFALQATFYLLALLGFAASSFGRAPFFMYVPFYFSNLNLALLVGFFKAVSGSARPAWDSTRRG